MSEVIFLTGDVHHMSMRGEDQRYLKMTEVQLADKYAKIARDYDIKVTLFITGRAFVEEPESIAKLVENDNIEIGGHTWHCFKPMALHYLSELTLKSFYGPRLYQRWDVGKTIAIIEKFTGGKCLSWTNHGLKGGRRLEQVLAGYGIKVISNRVDLQGKIQRLDSGLIDLPINTLPDHSHIYHGSIPKDHVEKDDYIRANGPLSIFALGRFPSKIELQRAGKELAKSIFRKPRGASYVPQEIYTGEQWLEVTKSMIEENLQHSGFATILAHPACMEILDGMRTFEALCRFLRSFPPGFVSQTVGFYRYEDE